ncbi:proteoglycan 4-like [Plutella xylostella]|uniref:proteoglycan 4-like n=1 Tax=Plutella xylostella TaxID=51655 RepID=UPI0020330047|nr:proteoglycan 4-like [Plutella xylostella]
MLPKIKNICNNGFPSLCSKLCDACRVGQSSKIIQAISIRQKSNDGKDNKDSDKKDKEEEAKRVLEECFGPKKPILDVTKAHHEYFLKYSKPPEVIQQECNVVIKEVFGEEQHNTAVTHSSINKDTDEKLITKIETVEDTDTVDVTRNNLADQNQPLKIIDGKKVENLNENSPVNKLLNHNLDNIKLENNKRVVPKQYFQDDQGHIKVWQSKLHDYIETVKSYDALRAKDKNRNRSTRVNTTDKRPMSTDTSPPIAHGTPIRLEIERKPYENVLKSENWNRENNAMRNDNNLDPKQTSVPDRHSFEAHSEMKNFVYDPSESYYNNDKKFSHNIGSINGKTKDLSTKAIGDNNMPRNNKWQKSRKEINLTTENERRSRNVFENTGNVEKKTKSDGTDKYIEVSMVEVVPKTQERTQGKFYMIRHHKVKEKQSTDSNEIKNKTKNENISVDLNDIVRDINQKGLRKGKRRIVEKANIVNKRSLSNKSYVDDTLNVVKTESEKRIAWIQSNQPNICLDLTQVLGSVHHDVSTTKRAEKEPESTVDIFSCTNKDPDTVVKVYEENEACNELERESSKETKATHELHALSVVHKHDVTDTIPQITTDSEPNIETVHEAQTAPPPIESEMTLKQMLAWLREKYRRRMFEELSFLNVTSKCPCPPKQPGRNHPPPIPPPSPRKMPPGCVPSCTPPCPASPCPPPKTLPRPQCPPKPMPKVCPDMPCYPKCPPPTPVRPKPKCPPCPSWPPAPQEKYPKACPPWNPPVPPKCPPHPQCPPQTPPKRPQPTPKPVCPQPCKSFTAVAPISLCAKCGQEVNPSRLVQTCLPINVSPTYKGSLPDTHDYSSSTAPCQPHFLPFPVTCNFNEISSESLPVKRKALKRRGPRVMPPDPKKGPGSGSGYPNTWISSTLGLTPSTDDLRLLKDIFRTRLFYMIFNFIDFSRKNIGMRDIVLVGFMFGNSTGSSCAGIFLNFRDKNYDPWIPIPSMLAPNIEKDTEQKPYGKGLPKLPSPKFKPWELNKSFKRKPPNQN